MFLDLAGETIHKVLPVSAKSLRVFGVIPGCRPGATTGRAAASEVDAPGPGNGPNGYRTEHNGTPDQNAGAGDSPQPDQEYHAGDNAAGTEDPKGLPLEVASNAQANRNLTGAALS
jgi:hypothetical protein